MRTPSVLCRSSRFIHPATPLAAAFFLALASTLSAGERLAEGIQDNSFLVEEAYNQEAGVVQHILLGIGTVDRFRGPDDRELALSFTQEWPVFTQAHQFSYSVPYSFLERGGSTENGVGDIFLNYRFQALFESDRLPAFAPRLSVILPTGNDDRGLGNGEVGYQINLPFSKVLSNRWTGHFNAGATAIPGVRGEDLVSYSLAGSFVYAVTENFNLMLEAVVGWDEDLAELGGTTRDFSALVSPGLRYAFNFPGDTQIVAGLAAPIGITGSAPDYGILLYFSFEHFFARPAQETSYTK